MLLLPTHSRWHLKLVLFVNDTTAIDSGTEKGMDWGGGILIGVCFELQWSNRLKANCLIQYSFCIKFGRFILFRLLLFCLVLGWTGECMVCTSKREQYRFDHVSSDAGIICTISTYLMNELIVCMWSINFKYQHSLILWFDWNPFELATAISFTILSCVQCSAVQCTMQTNQLWIQLQIALLLCINMYLLFIWECPRACVPGVSVYVHIRSDVCDARWVFIQILPAIVWAGGCCC